MACQDHDPRHGPYLHRNPGFKDGAPDPRPFNSPMTRSISAGGVGSFLTGMSATSVCPCVAGLEEAGIMANQGIGITENLLDARSLFLTPNTTTICVSSA